MAARRTALPLTVTERSKACVRLPLLPMIILGGSLFAGVRATPVVVFYVCFGILYALWALRLTRVFSADRRLGYLLALMDAAVLLPLAAWSAGPGTMVVVTLVCAGGLAVTVAADRRGRDRSPRSARLGVAGRRPAPSARVYRPDPRRELEAAVRGRLQVYGSTGSRFGLVVLRILRYEEISSYYGEDTALRTMTVVGRRGLRMLGQDAQRFPLPEGRIALLFDTEGAAAVSRDRDNGAGWKDPCDLEGLAMTLGRRVCEHLIEGHKVECVVGWASAPVDGLIATDLLAAAEAGARSTAAFRRVSGSPVVVRVAPSAGSRASAPPPERVRSAAG